MDSFKSNSNSFHPQVLSWENKGNTGNRTD